MNRYLIGSLLGLIGVGALVFIVDNAAFDKNVVKVYNWSDYIDEEILTEFTAETGIEVIYDVFDSNDVLETKMLAGKSGYDVVVPSGTFLTRQVQAGVFQKLDQSQLPNRKNMWPLIEQRVAEFGSDNNAYSVNYMWGTTGVGYNVDALKERFGIEEITSWDLVFQPENLAKFADCGVYFLNAADEMFPLILNYLALDPNSRNLADYEVAAEHLKKLRPSIRKFHSSEYISLLANGDICLAIGWSGDVLQSRDRADEADNGVRVNYSVPGEGAVMWFDQMAIPKDADNPENAHAFINYIMRPDVMAKASNYVFYANGNEASQPLLDEEILNDTAIYPDETTLKTLFAVQPYPPKLQRIVSRLWTKLSSGQ